MKFLYKSVTISSMENIKKPNFQNINLYRLTYGLSLTPEQIISTLDDQRYEEFISCWLIGCVINLYKDVKREYKEVEHLGGAGDKGRDVIAYVDEDKIIWDNYQCKHYSNSLSPTDIYSEVGKLLYYTYKNDFTIPRKYFFIAPKGVGPKLSDLVKKPNDFKREVISNWDTYCKNTITKKENVILDGDFRIYVESFDFSIFRTKGTQAILSEFIDSQFYACFFGGGFTKPRPLSRIPTEEMLLIEGTYITRLLEAYSDLLDTHINNLEQLSGFSKELKHFKTQRINFYKAESLKDYANESLPSETIFEEFQGFIYDALEETVNDEYENGYRCLKEALKEVQRIDLSGNIISQVTTPADRYGICHQLANDGKVKWVK